MTKQESVCQLRVKHMNKMQAIKQIEIRPTVGLRCFTAAFNKPPNTNLCNRNRLLYIRKQKHTQVRACVDFDMTVHSFLPRLLSSPCSPHLLLHFLASATPQRPPGLQEEAEAQRVAAPAPPACSSQHGSSGEYSMYREHGWSFGFLMNLH